MFKDWWTRLLTWLGYRCPKCKARMIKMGRGDLQRLTTNHWLAKGWQCVDCGWADVTATKRFTSKDL